ncbi:polysaccharide ABC transporter ATP-binding protein [Flavisolibacter ginsenosidimutans]|uniref:ATP-binding cassette domain-containing protein n=1 Tax=Flavisolibacter ginsenosidimutans TaxID=661481 RepID=A0A5B8UES5_9BACT|nr:polysaccharide ABC transporter ATP-binding protein [Flavisolibacter ginsenosidimutans]QEC54865.1 ATP-binding cassette domain-containing protein [Flavisolibacter ginsenosidimutans]
MSKTAIELSNLGKLYRLGEVGTGTVSHDLNRWLARLRGKEDPFAKVGEVNDRTKKGNSEYVWALKDISFSIPQGVVTGIIGRNGAGKSTLLKVLSKVTAPTTGRIKVKGRIASLLEVGTGFHPELTGRENIYLNGAILGMTKREITRKFDEIVDFAGVDRYIDTPVKRYSSGMYVRLAFAVAAYLESEILIVDEVLAVGDAEFQKKCLGRMKEVSTNEGRTILFVSHNMAAIKNLCSQCVFMNNGQVVQIGPTGDVLERYLADANHEQRVLNWQNGGRPSFPELDVQLIAVEDEKGNRDNALSTTTKLLIRIEYLLKMAVKGLRVTMSVYSYDDIEIFSSSDYDFVGESSIREAGFYSSICHIPSHLLNVGNYILKVHFDIPGIKNIIIDIPVEFNISEGMYNQLGRTVSHKPGGLIHPFLQWDVLYKGNGIAAKQLCP